MDKLILSMNVRYFIRSFMAGIIAICGAYTMWLIGPVIETTWYPVTSRMKVVKAEDWPEGGTLIIIEFDKLRDCELVQMAWFEGTPELGLAPVAVDLYPGDQLDKYILHRSPGHQIGGPWIVNVPREKIFGKTYVDLFHKCHPFWLTRTAFWP